jgi:class 3 adenylate cyclase
MSTGSPQTVPLPADPVLGAMAVAMDDAGQWGEIVDHNWRWVYVTDDLRLSYGGLLGLTDVAVDEHYFGRAAVETRLGWRAGPNTLELARDNFAVVGGLILADTAGGREELCETVHPELRDIVDHLSPQFLPALSFEWLGVHSGNRGSARVTAVRLHDDTGRFAGTALTYKPAASMAVLGAVAGAGDLRHFERMQSVAKPSRRPAAILFADLEASSPLARRLSTASYFALGRRLIRAADQCIIDSGGLVGRHVGDGVVAFFLAETAGSESAAARACITAARALRASLGEAAERSDLAPEEVCLRFGLHWGSRLYVGQITTTGRSEINALGDEVNETARIEACASGGRALASKNLLERLEPEDATALDLNPDDATYVMLGDLDTATEKARRDAPAIPVRSI